MKNETKKGTETQGENVPRETKKVRESGSNPSQTIKQLGGAIKNMQRLKMATDEEITTLKEMYNKILQRWIGGNLFE